MDPDGEFYLSYRKEILLDNKKCLSKFLKRAFDTLVLIFCIILSHIKQTINKLIISSHGVDMGSPVIVDILITLL